jgi:predicted naringenin-chalcone synthase
MLWQPSNKNYLMYLGKGISKFLGNHFLHSLKEDMQTLCNTEQCRDMEWCVHPGGRGILDALCDPKYMLGLNRDMLRHSYGTLDTYGNMSSGTILFVIQRMTADQGPDVKMSAFCLGFGPGLTVEMMVLQKILS